MRIRLVVLFAGLASSSLTAAQPNTCDKPKRKDTLPLLEAAQADELLADALEKVASTCEAKQPGCDDAKLKCQGFAESVNSRALVHDDAGFASDISGGWLGSKYIPTDVIPASAAEPPASCSLSAAELMAEASTRRSAALRHKKLQGEWEKWFTFARTVSDRCAAKLDGGSPSSTQTVTVPNPKGQGQGQNAVVTNPSDVARERQAEVDRQKAAIDQKYDEQKAKEDAARKAKEAEDARKKAELYQRLQMEALAKKKAEQEEQARVEAERKKRDAEKHDRELREKLERERLEREEAEAKARGAMEEAARKRAERDELERRDRAEAEA
ncbi:MAG: hypothetical protein ACJ790_08580, partial [Myxococcaceae bacterium]